MIGNNLKLYPTPVKAISLVATALLDDQLGNFCFRAGI